MEVVAFEAIMQLFLLGVLVPASHVEERERAREVSRFLEPSEGALDELVGEMEAPEDASAEAPEEAPAAAPRVVVVEMPEAAPMAAAVDAPEEQLPVAADQDEEPRLVEPEPLMPIPVILSFQRPAARRRKDSMDRARAAEVFHWSSGHSRNGR
jgi:hypothetical protein